MSWKRLARSQNILPESSQLAVYRWKGRSLLPFCVYLGLEAGSWAVQNIKRSFEKMNTKTVTKKMQHFPHWLHGQPLAFLRSLCCQGERARENSTNKPATSACCTYGKKHPERHRQKQSIETGLYQVTGYENLVLWHIFVSFSAKHPRLLVYTLGDEEAAWYYWHRYDQLPKS